MDRLLTIETCVNCVDRLGSAIVTSRTADGIIGLQRVKRGRVRGWMATNDKWSCMFQGASTPSTTASRAQFDQGLDFGCKFEKTGKKPSSLPLLHTIMSSAIPLHIKYKVATRI
jgi:hypothetical protein